MKTYLLITSLLLFTRIYAQGTHVFAGGELINYSIVDIATSSGNAWTTERSATPGYFTAIDTAAYTGCSNHAHINGYIKKIGNTAFIFPIGNGNQLHTLEISAPDLPTDAYATAWIDGDPSGNNDHTRPFDGTHDITAVSAPIVAVSNIGQWDWQTGENGALCTNCTGNGDGLFITVSIPDMTSFADASALRLVGWNGHTWTDLSSIATASGNTENSTLKGIMIPNISAIGIGKVRSQLPLRIAGFNASAVACKTQLTWSTSSESGAGSFVIEQSTDGISYVAITSIPAQGIITGSSYSTIVAQPAGTSYYRIRMIDSNGTFYYSDTSSSTINCITPDYIQVYPNPAATGSGQVTIQCLTSYRGNAALSVLNSLGQLIIQQEWRAASYGNRITLNISRLSGGTYFIRLHEAGGKQIGTTQTLIIQ